MKLKPTYMNTAVLLNGLVQQICTLCYNTMPKQLFVSLLPKLCNRFLKHESIRRVNPFQHTSKFSNFYIVSVINIKPNKLMNYHYILWNTHADIDNLALLCVTQRFWKIKSSMARTHWFLAYIKEVKIRKT